MGDGDILAVLNRLDVLKSIVDEQRIEQRINGDRLERVATDNEQQRVQLQALGTQLAGVDKKVDALCVGCAERHKRISEEIDGASAERKELRANLEKTRGWIRRVDARATSGDMTGPVKVSGVVAMWLERNWRLVVFVLAPILMAVPTVRGCLGERATEQLTAAVKRLEERPATKVIMPPPAPVPVPVKPDAEVSP